MKLVYLGTPEISVAPLRALVAAGHEVLLVVTNPDRRRSRGGRRGSGTGGRRGSGTGGGTSPSPVKAAAVELGIEVAHEPAAVLGAVERGAELGVVVAYGRLIKPPVLGAVPLVNLHFSLLPRWRGAAPVERSLLAGDERTGVCVMRLEEGLDTGGVYARAEVPIGPTTTAAELRNELVTVGTDLLVDTLSRPLASWIDDWQPQVGEPTYAHKLEAGELEIDWSRPVDEIDRLIRLGGAWTTFRDKRLKLLSARLVDAGGAAHLLEPIEVQPEGKGAMRFEDWRNGARPRPGELFG